MNAEEKLKARLEAYEAFETACKAALLWLGRGALEEIVQEVAADD